MRDCERLSDLCLASQVLEEAYVGRVALGREDVTEGVVCFEVYIGALRTFCSQQPFPLLQQAHPSTVQLSTCCAATLLLCISAPLLLLLCSSYSAFVLLCYCYSATNLCSLSHSTRMLFWQAHRQAADLWTDLQQCSWFWRLCY